MALSITAAVANSIASFPWADQVPPGTYACEIEVTKGEQIVTAPTARPGTLYVRADLDPSAE